MNLGCNGALCHLSINFQPINIDFLIKSITIDIKTPNTLLEKKTDALVEIRVEILQSTIRLMIKLRP